MIGEVIQLDEKTVSKVEFPESTAPAQPETGKPERTGVSVDDLIHAASHGFAMILRYLLAAGIDPNGRDAQGRTALQVAPTREIHDMLVEAGAKPDSCAA